MIDHLKLLLSILTEIIGVILLYIIYNRKEKLKGVISYFYAQQLIVLIVLNTMYILVKYFGLNITQPNNTSESANFNQWFSAFFIVILLYFIQAIRVFVTLFWEVEKKLFNKVLAFIILITISVILLTMLSRNDLIFEISHGVQRFMMMSIVVLDPTLSLIVILWGRKIVIEDIDIKRLRKLHALKVAGFIIFALIIIVSTRYNFFEIITFPFLILVLLITTFLFNRFFHQHVNKSSKSRMNEIRIKYSLTTREMEIINLLIQGKSNKEIEGLLYISNSTVKNHLSNIYKKCKVSSRLELSIMVKDFLSDWKN